MPTGQSPRSKPLRNNAYQTPFASKVKARLRSGFLFSDDEKEFTISGMNHLARMGNGNPCPNWLFWMLGVANIGLLLQMAHRLFSANQSLYWRLAWTVLAMISIVVIAQCVARLFCSTAYSKVDRLADLSTEGCFILAASCGDNRFLDRLCCSFFPPLRFDSRL